MYFENKLPQEKVVIKEDTTFSAQLVFSSNELKFYAEAISFLQIQQQQEQQNSFRFVRLYLLGIIA